MTSPNALSILAAIESCDGTIPEAVSDLHGEMTEALMNGLAASGLDVEDLSTEALDYLLHSYSSVAFSWLRGTRRAP